MTETTAAPTDIRLALADTGSKAKKPIESTQTRFATVHPLDCCNSNSPHMEITKYPASGCVAVLINTNTNTQKYRVCHFGVGFRHSGLTLTL